LEYLGKLFLKKILDGEKIDFVNKHEATIKYLWNEVEEYFEQKEWCKNHHSYVFILPYEESLVGTTDLNDLNAVFYASSFVLPPSHTKIEKDYLKVKEYFEEVRLYIKSGKHFRNEIDKIRSLNEELDKKDFKSIEIISIFTAIITFVLSSIPSYKFVDSVFESVLFMLSLASSLSLFIILILFTTRNLFNKWQAYIAIIFLLLVSGLGYFKLFQQETNIKRKVDVNVKVTMGKNKNSKE
jgi:ABC-type multidrug transport system fused ATPase/permease subunit